MDDSIAGDSATGDSTTGDSAADEASRDTLAAAADAARNAEMDARLEVRTAEERLRAIAGRADALVAAAAAERQAAERAAARRQLRERQALVARAVAEGATLALARLAESLAMASEQRLAAEQASKGRAVALQEVRAQVRQLAAEFDRVVDAAHGSEMARAEHRMRLEQLTSRAAEEFGVTVPALVAEYGPEVLIPVMTAEEPVSGATMPTEGPTGAADGRGVPWAPDDLTQGQRPQNGSGGHLSRDELAAGSAASIRPAAGPAPDAQPACDQPGVRYVRAEQERRAAAAQRQLDQLGKVNPLALEEFAALEERHAFLATQLEDLKKTRSDLLTVVKEVDDRVQQVFAAAFEDTAREFERIFCRLFPGGEGRLILTEPDDMLATGIDFEARPPGKKVKRMSLLSGGERSLTAIAFLLAIFKARPSPFYVLDEVEAALDDTNMQRLLDVFEELRTSLPAAHHHPPEADHGGRRRPVRNHHAGRWRVHGDQPAAAGAGDRLTGGQWTLRGLPRGERIAGRIRRHAPRRVVTPPRRVGPHAPRRVGPHGPRLGWLSRSAAGLARGAPSLRASERLGLLWNL